MPTRPLVQGFFDEATNTVSYVTSDPATKVGAIQFSFTTAVENGYTGYAELDVVGQPSVPEPASVGLLATGAIGLLARRRRA